MMVLQVAASSSCEWGGPITVIAGLSEKLVSKGIRVTVFAPTKQGSLNGLIRPIGVDVKTFKHSLLAGIWTAYSADLARALHREAPKFDLIHIHEIWHYPCYAAHRVAKKVGKPYVITIHGALAPWALGYKSMKKKIYAALIQKRILNEAAAIHAITEEEVKHIQAFGIKTPVIMIPNGIDTEEFQDLPPKEEMEGLYPELAGRKVLPF